MTTTELESRVAVLEAQVARLKEQLEHAEALAGIKRGLQAADAGHMAPTREVLENLRQKHNIVRT